MTSFNIYLCVIFQGIFIHIVVVSRSVVSNSLQPNGLQHTRLSGSFTISRSLVKLMSVDLVMPSSHLVFCCPFLLLPSVFPSIRIFSSELALHIRWPKFTMYLLPCYNCLIMKRRADVKVSWCRKILDPDWFIMRKWSNEPNTHLHKELRSSKKVLVNQYLLSKPHLCSWPLGQTLRLLYPSTSGNLLLPDARFEGCPDFFRPLVPPE